MTTTTRPHALLKSPLKNPVKWDLTRINPYKDYMMSHYTSSCTVFTNMGFEKKLVRASFKKAFGEKLPGSAQTQISTYFFDPCVTRLPNPPLLLRHDAAKGKVDPAYGVASAKRTVLNSSLVKQCMPKPKGRFELGCKLSYKPPQKQLLTLNYLSASWVLEHLKTQFRLKRSARAIFNTTLNEVSLTMTQLKSACPIKGIRLSASGRLGKRKKAMAQQLSRSLGAVPLSGFKHKVDLSQDFVTTSLGTVGLKVWVCYA